MMPFLRDIAGLLVMLGVLHVPATAETPIVQSQIQPGCAGALQQGGLLVCRGPAGTRFRVGDLEQTTDADEAVTFGLRRNAPNELIIEITPVNAPQFTQISAIASREDPYRVLEGLECDKVDARTPDQKAHAARSWTRKQTAFATFNDGRGALDGFRRPAEGRESSPFGPTRKYIGVSAETGEPCEKTSVHQGYDIAAPIGTEIVAPAGGTVILSDDDLYYEGGAIFLDHGHGLVSVFMHMSTVDVADGDVVSVGDRLGAVGNTGRTTGPHLHWAVKWRNEAREDRSGDFYIDPALLLEISSVD